jgi:NAD(P)-dependent dehydrogenase (short-subunit alcohol dehydrogenase family)
MRLKSGEFSSALDQLTVLVNNAGIYRQAGLQDENLKLWFEIFNINFFSSVAIARELMPLLIANNGVVLNIASGLGLRPTAQTGAYSSSKAAMVNWTQSLALEFGPKGVRANCICPGIVDTPIHAFHDASSADSAAMKTKFDELQPLGRVGRPEEIAAAAWSLAGPGSEWTTGSILTVDGGLNLT